ncbi:sigma-54-dependent Fis family transcriptional regulator [Cupriavidus necator]|uniref:Sigma-54-dependent Fis family transcriptional regulator n=1 Tax=Cupriavidus necator TaxID=106590 RepID=A0A367PJ34_CUPNE|nr:sigma 54-interacting transcriptional regulator [Cupriavidus necator]QQX86351.1 sigma-54-dependent Fis family transcriptional regulator [Cupriavidus necator]RCJ07115.1 sigma-54-dependent Fis family transcriptional regulator [Cupriavidus necator]
MRTVLYQEDAGQVTHALCRHGLPDGVGLSASGDGLLVVVVRAAHSRVAEAAEQWLRGWPLPDAFIVGCTDETRCHCRPESWWPSSVCDIVTAVDDDSLLKELALRLTRLAELEEIVTSDWLRRRAVGESIAWRSTLRAVAEAGRLGRGACLLLGESGVGKELLARLVHDLDPSRRRGPFVVVDCTTLSPELSGSELFGHAKGAFTHAVTARDGAVALADCGTLFLDEIGELELPLQARLLRVIQERMYKRVGEDTWRRSDFRLTCATNRDLEAEVEAGRFRCDLYFRISQWTVRAPSLSERREDIPLLVRHFLSEHDDAPRIMPEVMEQLMCRDYPGNVRELRNVVLRMAERQRGFGVLSTGSLDRPSIPAAADELAAWTQMLALAVEGALDAGLGLKHIGQIAETIAVQAAERRTGSTNRAAELLQVTPRALQLRRQVRPDGGSA